MRRAIAVLRPEPGNVATAKRIEQAGLTAFRLPLFATHAIDWTPPDPGGFDALILTSANAARLGRDGLEALTALPVYAVGETTAKAARESGLTVTHVGTQDADTLAAEAEAMGVRRALFLCGRDHRLRAGGIVAQAIPVYAADPLPVDLSPLSGSIALLHSSRAAKRLAALADAGPGRDGIAIVTISRAVAEAAGPGWASLHVAPAPSDEALVALAVTLAD